MTAPKWLTPAGFLGTFTQGIAFKATGTNLTLPFNTSVSDATYSVISGSLPSGLLLYKDTGVVYGTPFYVNQVVSSEFVVRASNSDGVADRTFLIDIEGPRAPKWVTEPGLLPVGPNLEHYALNKNKVDIQLRATVTQLPKGETLRYYLKENAGQLPPGLKLTQAGRLSGFVDDQLQLDYQASENGGYDDEYYDAYPYDHVLIVNNIKQGRPESISKIYQFVIVATDGISESERAFKIKVDDPNSLRADNSYIDVDTTLYLADIGYLIPPIWEDQFGNEITNPANLGVLRANNYQVIPLQVYDPYPFVGPISYDWTDRVFNPEIKMITSSEYNLAGYPTQNLFNQPTIFVKSASNVPQVGMLLTLESHVAGADKKQYWIQAVSAVTGGYLLTLGVKANYIRDIVGPNLTNAIGQRNAITGMTYGDMYIYNEVVTVSPKQITVHYWIWTENGWFESTTPIVIAPGAHLNIDIPDTTIIYCGSPAVHPTGLSLNTETGDLYGAIPYQPAYSKAYRFTVRITKQDFDTKSTVFRDQIFNLILRGDVETTIQFVSSSTVGTIQPGKQSELYISAEHTIGNFNINYSLTGGKLPNGLSLTRGGSIVGKVPFGNLTTVDTYADSVPYSWTAPDGTSESAVVKVENPNNAGLEKFTLDGGKTTIDRGYQFEVTANDAYLLASVSKTFNIQLVERTSTAYTGLYFKPLMNVPNRQYYRSLTQDYKVFSTDVLYRPDDPAFGVQSQLKLYLEYGLEKLNLDNYVPALVNYFKRKRFYFGDLKTAVAKDSNGNTAYEVVYIDVVDDQMINNVNPDASFSEIINSQVTVFYPDSVGNMQVALETLPTSETTVIKIDNEFRPRFMQTVQDSTGIPLGFVKAAILCYAVPGKGATVISRIKASGFNFKQLDFDVDRLFVEAAKDAKDSANPTQYLVFGSTGVADTGFNIVTEDYTDLIGGGVDILTEDGIVLTI